MRRKWPAGHLCLARVLIRERIRKPVCRQRLVRTLALGHPWVPRERPSREALPFLERRLDCLGRVVRWEESRLEWLDLA